MAEDYIRPPLVAREPASRLLALWRFRLLAFALLAVLTYLVVLIFLRFSGVNAEDPGIGALLSGNPVPLRG